MIAIAEKQKTNTTYEEQIELLESAASYLLQEGLINAEDFEVIDFGIDPSSKPHEHYAALKVLRKKWRQLEKASIYLPKIANWKSKYHFDDSKMQVWNLTKQSGPYQLSYASNGLVLECNCVAAQHGSDCNHIEYAYSILDNKESAEATDFTFGGGVNAQSVASTTDNEILPGIFASPSQWVSLQGMLAFARGKKGVTYSLSGAAGTGKSLLVQAMVSELRRAGSGLRVCFTAPTNKATNVLRSMVETWSLNIECLTCAKLLGLVPIHDPETGEESFERSSSEDSVIGNFDLIVVDESSMVSSSLFHFLMEEVYAQQSIFGDDNADVRILFMGDPYQAPPVKESISKVFSSIPEGSALTEIKRYEGAIAEIVEDFRTNLDRRKIPVFKTEHTKEKGGVIVAETKAWNSYLVKAFKSAKNAGDVRAIAYTNSQVAKLNKMVRAAIHGKDAPQFVKGERLISGSHYSMQDAQGKDVKLLSTSDEVEVIRAIEGKQGDFKVWFLTVQMIGVDAQPETMPVMHQDSQADFERHLDGLWKTKRFEAWRQCRSRYACLDYAYAVTGHKSQGSTFKSVFVDLPNFSKNKTHSMVKFPGCDEEQLVYERNQLLYVACSRPSKNLFLKIK